MKAMKYLSMVLLVLVTSVCMFSCSDDDDPTLSGNTSFTGTWVSDDEYSYGGVDVYVRIRFEANNTGVFSFVSKKTILKQEYIRNKPFMSLSQRMG